MSKVSEMKEICPVCHKTAGRETFQCLSCVSPKWVHLKFGGYKYADVQNSSNLQCNRCKMKNKIKTAPSVASENVEIFPTENSNDAFELFLCPYDPVHKITSKQWRYHLQKCKSNYGGKMANCPFNHSHTFPEPEFDWHVTKECPDLHIIANDVHQQDNWKMATTVDHHCDKDIPSEENWEDEVEEDAERFEIDPSMGMPIYMQTAEENSNQIKEEYYYEDDDEEEAVGDEELQTLCMSVLQEELLPEKPPNWNDMNKNQKKNYKRKYDRQRQRMQDQGVRDADFEGDKDPSKWTYKQRDAKLAAIRAAFPLAEEKMNASRFDFTSQLNIVCQKVRWNLPEFRECTSLVGKGFGYKCRVGQEWFESREFASTKKDAKHNAAKWTLLGLNIPGLDGTSGQPKMRPVHPHHNMSVDRQQLREANEQGRLIAAGYPTTKPVQQLRRPHVAQQQQQNQQPAQQQQTSPQNQPLPKQQQQQQRSPQQQNTWQQPPQMQQIQQQQQVRQQQQVEQQRQQHQQQQQLNQQRQQAKANPWRNAQQHQQQPQQWGQQNKQQPQEWGQQQSQQRQQQQQRQQPQKQHQQTPQQWGQQQPQQRQQQPQQWDQQPRQQQQQQRQQQQWGQPQQQQQQQQKPLCNLFQSMTVTEEDYPTLGGAPKQSTSGGVGGERPRGRGGRGRGTTLKIQ